MQHQLHLFFGKVGVDDRQRQRVKGQIPGRIPGILPLVGHRDDVLVEHVEPFRVPGVTVSGVERIRIVLIQPVVAVKEKELLAPHHAGQRLAHDVRFIGTHRRWRDGLVKFIGLVNPVLKHLIELLGQMVFPCDWQKRWKVAGESQLTCRRLH